MDFLLSSFIDEKAGISLFVVDEWKRPGISMFLIAVIHEPNQLLDEEPELALPI